ncbi:hypothetical protein EC968_001380 [Mortierella alpina]|nr:hypothetical protein EC968_001380 [Mortierella alpina]
MRLCFSSFAIAVLATLVVGTPMPQAQSLKRRSETTAYPPKTEPIAGLNNWNCKPSSEHPHALVLVHAMFPNATVNWFYMAPKFIAKGYCVFALNYGAINGGTLLYGVDSMEISAQQLAVFIDKVLAATNTTQVDLLGQSEGTLMPRYYLKFLGGATKVHKFAGFSSNQYGTTFFGLTKLLQPYIPYEVVEKTLDSVCRSCAQHLAGAPFLEKLNEGGDTVPGVQYLMIASKVDQVVTPYMNGFLRDDNPNVRNQVLQDWCSYDISEHVFQMLDPLVFAGVHAFFTPSANQKISCLDYHF